MSHSRRERSRRGGSRRGRERPAGRVVRALCISVAVAALTASAVSISAYLLYPVAGMEIEGSRMFPEKEARQEVPDGASLLLLDASGLQRKVESNPWVKSAEVTKDWGSDIVRVQVEERRAVLKGELGDQEVVLAQDGTRLPGLGGASLPRVRLDEHRLERIVEAQRVLDRNGVEVEAFREVDAGGVEVAAGHEGAESRPVVFSGEVSDSQARALRNLLRDEPEAPYFDLRSPQRVVVGGGAEDS